MNFNKLTNFLTIIQIIKSAVSVNFIQSMILPKSSTLNFESFINSLIFLLTGKNAEIDPLSADSNGPRTDKSLMHIHKVNTSKIVCLGLCIVQTEREQLAAINRIYRQRFLHYMKKWTLNQVKFNQKSVWFYEKNLKTVLKHR
jgi:hypothetical protein